MSTCCDTVGRMKTCTKCKVLKSTSDFTRDSRRKDGLNCWCRECTRANSRGADPEKAKKRGAAWYASNKERHRARVVAWLAANPGKSAEYSQKWRDANPEKSVESNRVWYANNRKKKLDADKARRETNLQKFLERERASYLRNRATVLAKNARWRKDNPERIAALASARRSAKAERTPPWLSEEQHEEILEYFIEAARLSDATGIDHHVDHIVPLRGKSVCGLHVPWNMQVLTATENLKKNNRHEA